jgi:hypothetical protein
VTMPFRFMAVKETPPIRSFLEGGK